MDEPAYRRLQVWQKAMVLARDVYLLTRNMPSEERFGLTSQTRRAAASIPANLAEGSMRGSRKDYAHFVSIARGSCAEVETFLLLAESIDALPAAQVKSVLEQAAEVGRMLTSLRIRLLASPRT